MTFLVPLALLVSVLLIAPIVAHAKSRGRAEPTVFPGARLVQAKETTSRQTRRLDDKWLLLLRILLVLCLALLGATPLASCSRLSLSRNGGASLAVALVIDDSQSMRAQGKRGTHFAQAVTGARQLIAGARPDDSFALILAGNPARLVVPPTSDLASVDAKLQSLRPSDRPSDLRRAEALAQGALTGLPQGDKRVVLLSDFATEAPLTLTAGTLAPLKEIRQRFENCAIARASRAPAEVSVEIRCTSPLARGERQVELLDAEGQVLRSAPLNDTLTLSDAGMKDDAAYRVRLTPPKGDARDQISEDDMADVLPRGTDLVVGLRADPERAGVETGTSTAPRLALDSLESGAKVENLNVLPETAAELDAYAALVIDEPAGFTPEARDALETWVKRGGVAALFLGPSLVDAPLGATFEPFLGGAPTWSSDGPFQVKKEGALGPLVASWQDLNATGRAVSPTDPSASVLAEFTDGLPLVTERTLGHGLLLNVFVPSSLKLSELALRPAYLELLDRVLRAAALRRGSLASVTGSRLPLPGAADVTGPSGPVETQLHDGRLFFETGLAGEYTLTDPERSSKRYAVIDPEEAVRQPKPPLGGDQSALSGSAQKSQVDISRWLALAALILAALELGLRLWLRSRRALVPA